MAPFGAAAGVSASLRLRLRYAPTPAMLRTPHPGTSTEPQPSLLLPITIRFFRSSGTASEVLCIGVCIPGAYTFCSDTWCGLVKERGAGPRLPGVPGRM